MGRTFLQQQTADLDMTFENFVALYVADMKCWATRTKRANPIPVYLKTLHNQLSAVFNHAVRHYNLKVNPAAQAGNMEARQRPGSSGSGIRPAALPHFPADRHGLYGSGNR